jgi:NitT/TauT family transport system substrate-binding protein
VPKLFATYKASAEWLVAHPDEAAKLISPKGSAEDQRAVADLIRANNRLGLNIRWAGEVRSDIERVYAAGRATGFLPSDPAASSVYQGN